MNEMNFIKDREVKIDKNTFQGQFNELNIIHAIVLPMSSFLLWMRDKQAICRIFCTFIFREFHNTTINAKYNNRFLPPDPYSTLLSERMVTKQHHG